jgi:hypothetical protein
MGYSIGDSNSGGWFSFLLRKGLGLRVLEADPNKNRVAQRSLYTAVCARAVYI